MRKEKLFLITGCFRKPFKMIISHFFFISQAHSQRNYDFFDIRDIKRGNWEQQIATNGKLNIYFKNNFNVLVMNVTQLSFLY